MSISGHTAASRITERLMELYTCDLDRAMALAGATNFPAVCRMLADPTGCSDALSLIAASCVSLCAASKAALSRTSCVSPFPFCP